MRMTLGFILNYIKTDIVLISNAISGIMSF